MVLLITLALIALGFIAFGWIAFLVGGTGFIVVLLDVVASIAIIVWIISRITNNK